MNRRTPLTHARPWYGSLLFSPTLAAVAEAWWRRMRTTPHSLDMDGLQKLVPAGKVYFRKRHAMRGTLASAPFAARRDIRNGLAFVQLLLPLLFVSVLCYGASFLHADFAGVLRVIAYVGLAGFVGMPVALFGHALVTLIDHRIERGVETYFAHRGK